MQRNGHLLEEQSPGLVWTPLYTIKHSHFPHIGPDTEYSQTYTEDLIDENREQQPDTTITPSPLWLKP